MSINHDKKHDLEKQGYRIVGSHSAVKTCLWTKKSIVCPTECYKGSFYGIRSWRCVQMSPSLFSCTHRCVWCWRDIAFTRPEWVGRVDEPKQIVDGCIREHIKLLMGYWGNSRADRTRLYEAKRPLHFAISLISEPCFYPRLPELINEIHNRGMTTFLVTNGTLPEMLERLIKNPPTQLYITLPAPNEQLYRQVCNPLIKDGWSRIMRSLELLGQFSCRRTIRMTLVKGYNMVRPEQYAELLSRIKADFIELKAYMFVGYSQQRLSIGNMPEHEEILGFAKQIASHSQLKIIDQRPESRVVLMMKRDSPDRVMRF